MEPRIPLAALGPLAYGGRLHWLMAGSVYAGTGVAAYCLDTREGAPCVTGCRRRGRGLAELYYMDPMAYQELRRRLHRLGLTLETVAVEPLGGGGAGVAAEAPSAGGCPSPTPASVEPGKPARWLVALPPQLPPPAPPMASMEALLPGFEVCSGQRCFTPSRGGGVEAVVVDVVASLERLRGWAEAEAGAALAGVAAELRPLGLRGLVVAPARGWEEHV